MSLGRPLLRIGAVLVLAFLLPISPAAPSYFQADPILAQSGDESAADDEDGLPAEDEPAAVDEVTVALDRRFAYQGELTLNNNPVTGVCDFRFRLFDAGSGGVQIGSQQFVLNVSVSGGRFSVVLNQNNEFGNNAFTGHRRWLEVAVRCPAGSGSYTTLSPRQPLNATPNAAFALRAGTAANATNATNAVNAQSVPWSGVSGVPANIANPPTYTAGPGLQLTGGQFSVAFGGSGSANNAARSDHTHFGQGWSGSSPAAGLVITNSAGSGITGVSASTSGRGLFGRATAGSGITYGVYGQSASNTGYGVFGRATAASGATYGVYGQSASIAGFGVVGWASAASGPTHGMWGQSDSPAGRGIFGWASAATGGTSGVFGQSASNAGYGVFGLTTAGSGSTRGVFGQSNSTAGVGVVGWAAAQTGSNVGMWGQSDSIAGRGVVGWVPHGSGSTTGVWGQSASSIGTGVLGFASAATGVNQGVYGLSASTSGRGVIAVASAGSGVTYGVWAETKSTQGAAVRGHASATSGNAHGVLGRSDAPQGRAVWALAGATSGVNYAVYGNTLSPDGYAGFFSGKVYVEGNLSKASGSFLIDHPLDPENKLLAHSFVESPDMMNVYNGNVILDGEGAAWVELPAYFQALNRDFRYQLTPIGAPGPNLYIAAKIQDNRFRIAGGSPGMEVSWLVTGIRQDAYANANRIVVEEDKPAEERGTFLHPTAFGQPPERGANYHRMPLDERLNATLDELPDVRLVERPDIWPDALPALELPVLLDE